MSMKITEYKKEKQLWYINKKEKQKKKKLKQIKKENKSRKN